MLAAALELEADEYVAGLRGQLDELGRRLVVRNGYARSRTITTAAGPVEIRAPRVTTAEWIPTQADGASSPLRSCRHGVGGARR
jgi:transposase-like protein